MIVNKELITILTHLLCKVDSEWLQNQEIVDAMLVLKSKDKSFKPPSLEEVENYLVSRNILNPKENAERFINFYESKGWMIGKNKMKSWQSAVKSWNLPVRHSKSTTIIV